MSAEGYRNALGMARAAWEANVALCERHEPALVHKAKAALQDVEHLQRLAGAVEQLLSGVEFVEQATDALGGGLVLDDEQLAELTEPDPGAIVRDLFDRHDRATLDKVAQQLLVRLSDARLRICPIPGECTCDPLAGRSRSCDGEPADEQPGQVADAGAGVRVDGHQRLVLRCGEDHDPPPPPTVRLPRRRV